MIPQRPIVLEDLFQIAARQEEIAWLPFREGVEIHRIYQDGDYGPNAALLRFQPGSRVEWHEHAGFEHILVLSGSQSDQNGTLAAGSLLVHPPGSGHSVMSEEGCIVLAIYERAGRFNGEQA